MDISLRYIRIAMQDFLSYLHIMADDENSDDFTKAYNKHNDLINSCLFSSCQQDIKSKGKTI